jgi:hypothetical protein
MIFLIQKYDARRLLPLIALIALARCEITSDWAYFEDFERGLRCGMTMSEVEALAKRLGAEEFGKPQITGQPDSPDYFVLKNDRYVNLWFHNGGLVEYVSGILTLEDKEASPRTNLCVKTLQP